MKRLTHTASRRRFLREAGAVTGAAMAVTGAPLISGDALLAAQSQRRQRWAFLVDLERCIGCKACAVACKTEFGVPLGVFRASVKEHEAGEFPEAARHFVPWLCNHCKRPICLTECPVDEIEVVFRWPDLSQTTYLKRATYKRPDGPVLIDQDRCVGCGACVELCPYHVRFLNPARRNADGDPVAEKCTLCVHRLDAGLVPACVNTCQAGARLVGDLADPESEIAQRIRGKKVQVLKPEAGTDPQCMYIGLDPQAYAEGRDIR